VILDQQRYMGSRKEKTRKKEDVNTHLIVKKKSMGVMPSRKCMLIIMEKFLP